VQNIAQAENVKTRDLIAQRAGFGNHETMTQARRVVERGAPEVIAAMDAGERQHGDLKAAAAKAGFKYDTLKQYAWVARRFERCTRVHTLEFFHHRAVASLPDEAAFRLLQDAEVNDLSVAQLRLRHASRASSRG
jgi:hypothetical protein